MMTPAHRREYYRVENYEQVYADVEARRQKPRRAAAYHRAIGKVLKPNTQFGPGVEDRIAQEKKNGAQLGMAFSHGKLIDPPQIAAMAEQNEVFEDIIGRTTIGAKIPLFTVPILGGLIPDLGASPIWRKKDVLDEEYSDEVNELLNSIRLLAGERSIQSNIMALNEGLHMAKHVEGTRNKEHPNEILEVRRGFGEEVAGADQSRDILIVTAAFWYGKSIHDLISPTIYLDIPDNQRRDEPELVTATVSESLQYSLNQAVLLHS